MLRGSRVMVVQHTWGTLCSLVERVTHASLVGLIGVTVALLLSCYRRLEQT